MPFIETSEGRLFFADHRTSASTPMLLIHGAGGSRLDWPKELRRLPQANALLLDLPGHGKSDPPGRDNIDGFVQAVIAFLDALEIEQIIVTGHSMGGAIAQGLSLSHTRPNQTDDFAGNRSQTAGGAYIVTTTSHDNAQQAIHTLAEWMLGNRPTRSGNAQVFVRYRSANIVRRLYCV